ncbi:hypothetical protein QE152_g33141 [Popillia japonica]|uniref:Uncharacterized protein n=1 Tax=Popillia japonica TaxID=7064 RepID=A0AAW1IY20_POPJA
MSVIVYSGWLHYGGNDGGGPPGPRQNLQTLPVSVALLAYCLTKKIAIEIITDVWIVSGGSGDDDESYITCIGRCCINFPFCTVDCGLG